MVTFGSSTVKEQELDSQRPMRSQMSGIGTRRLVEVDSNPRTSTYSYDEAVQIIQPQAPQIQFLQNKDNYVNVMYAIAGRRKRLRSHQVASRVDDVKEYLLEKTAPQSIAVQNGVADILLAGGTSSS